MSDIPTYTIVFNSSNIFGLVAAVLSRGNSQKIALTELTAAKLLEVAKHITRDIIILFDNFSKDDIIAIKKAGFAKIYVFSNSNKYNIAPILAPVLAPVDEKKTSPAEIVLDIKELPDVLDVPDAPEVKTEESLAECFYLDKLYNYYPIVNGTFQIYFMEKIICYCFPQYISNLDKSDYPVNYTSGSHLVNGLALRGKKFDETVIELLKTHPMKIYEVEAEIALLGKTWSDLSTSIAAARWSANHRKCTISGYSCVAVYSADLLPIMREIGGRYLIDSDVSGENKEKMEKSQLACLYSLVSVEMGKGTGKIEDGYKFELISGAKSTIDMAALKSKLDGEIKLYLLSEEKNKLEFWAQSAEFRKLLTFL